MAYKKVKLYHISLKALEVGHHYKYSIYYKNKDSIFKTIIENKTMFSDEVQQKIKALNIKDVYVLTKNHKQYEIDTQNYLSKIIDSDDISVKLKSEILHEMASDTMHELFNGDLNTKKIERSSELVNDTINIILNDKSAIKAMIGVTTYDYYTYTHCVNVSIYALGFCAYLNLDKSIMHTIGRAAILHDLGKQYIPNEIVNKNGKLTEQEFNTMKNHPTYGANALRDLGETNKLVLDIIEQHHEKLDGSGYPYGLEEKDINRLAMIVTIADVFDALTTKRSYKAALTTYRALIIMEKEMKNELNPKLLKKFITFMSKNS